MSTDLGFTIYDLRADGFVGFKGVVSIFFKGWIWRTLAPYAGAYWERWLEARRLITHLGNIFTWTSLDLLGFQAFFNDLWCEPMWAQAIVGRPLMAGISRGVSWLNGCIVTSG